MQFRERIILLQLLVEELHDVTLLHVVLLRYVQNLLDLVLVLLLLQFFFFLCLQSEAIFH